MSDEMKPQDPGALWRNQPWEALRMSPALLVKQRSREITVRTREEVVMIVAAAALFVAFLAWRFNFPHGWPQWAALAGFISWCGVAVYFSGRRLRAMAAPAPDALAATCLEFYRRQLELRRDHLRSEWLWLGPVLLALIIFWMMFLAQGFSGMRLTVNLLPVVLALLAWIVFGIRHRRRMTRQIQQEIDELKQP